MLAHTSESIPFSLVAAVLYSMYVPVVAEDLAGWLAGAATRDNVDMATISAVGADANASNLSVQSATVQPLIKGTSRLELSLIF